MSAVEKNSDALLPGHVTRALGQRQGLSYALLDHKLVLQQVAPNFDELSGWREESAVGHLLTDVFQEFVGAEDALRAILQGGPATYRLDHVNRMQTDQSIRYVSFQVTPVGESGGADGLLLLIEDTTEAGKLQQSLVQDRNELRLVRRELALANEELQQLNRLKSLFLSMAAHDLRTPLASIRGFAEMLRDDLPGSASQEIDMLEIILSQAHRLQHLISDLLDLDQVDRGQVTINLRQCALDEVVSEVVHSMRPLSERRQVTIEMNISTRPLQLQADPDRLAQIVYNLLSNAVKYTAEGSRVEVGACYRGDDVLLHVADNGRGLTAEQIGQLFTLYYRTEEARQSAEAGTGIGLFIVKMLVEAHHGEITVESAAGQGTMFYVRLPASQKGTGDGIGR